MTTSLQPLAVKTHSEFFFNDGNAMLRVKGSATANASVDATKTLCSTPDGSSTSDTTYTYFRVHKSILSDLSDVFSTMFSIPQSESQSSDPFTYEGCDMVELHDDVSDVTKLMKVIYGR
ncbi:hypothetical protein FRC03_005276 [Tulasnella sp. 419]|nr:hypothetical protein FRC03_005276 [Tulasnella sp. 419]